MCVTTIHGVLADTLEVHLMMFVEISKRDEENNFFRQVQTHGSRAVRTEDHDEEISPRWDINPWVFVYEFELVD